MQCSSCVPVILAFALVSAAVPAMAQSFSPAEIYEREKPLDGLTLSGHQISEVTEVLTPQGIFTEDEFSHTFAAPESMLSFDFEYLDDIAPAAGPAENVSTTEVSLTTPPEAEEPAAQQNTSISTPSPASPTHAASPATVVSPVVPSPSAVWIKSSPTLAPAALSPTQAHP